MDLQRIIYLVKETKEIITNREMAAHVKEKGVADYVTQVDVAVQNFLKEELYKLYPEIQFLGEETGLQQMNTDSYWILDPVDGTTNLIHDYHHSVVSLALCQQNEIVLGIVYDPYHDEVFSAVKGEGSFLNGKPLPKNCRKLSSVSELLKENWLKKTLLGFSRSTKTHKTSEDWGLRHWNWHIQHVAGKVDILKCI